MPDSNRGKHCRLSYTLENRPPVVKVENLAQSGHRRCKTLVDKVSGTLAVMEMQTLGETLVEVDAKALVDLRFKTRKRNTDPSLVRGAHRQTA